LREEGLGEDRKYFLALKKLALPNVMQCLGLGHSLDNLSNGNLLPVKSR
jgi:hypothetical protein